MRTRPLVGLLVGGVLLAGIPLALHALKGHSPANATMEDPALAKAKAAKAATSAPALAPPFVGLDLTHITVDDGGGAAAAGDGRVARLTVDAHLQRAADAILERHQLDEAAVVALDAATGEVLAYASRARGGRDMAREATAPAASVFKIVTGAALVERAGLGPDTRECYAGGGEQRIVASDLVQDSLRDRYCVSLGTAMGKSTNAVFARRALRDLPRAQLEETARALGFGEPVPFDVEVQKSELTVPQEDLGYARTAAGFWNTTLSPLHAAWLSATVAHSGEAMRPFIVRELHDAQGKVLYTAPAPAAVRRAIKPDTATQVAQMMEHTVTEGTSFKAFHDAGGRSFLHGITVAGKTGTLAEPKGDHLYTWFTAFAPVHPGPGERQIAVGVLVVNPPKWKVKANVVAREVLEAWFYPNRPIALQTAARKK
jgi:cell division protein FtsI/penicillin-binding protein 2